MAWRETSEKSGKIKCATFLHVAGDDANKVFNTFTFDGNVDDFEVLYLPNTANHKKPDIPESDIYSSQEHNAKQSVDAYVTDLKNKAKDCGFGELMK